MRRLLLTLPVLFVMALAGCSNTGQYLTQVSNKNAKDMTSNNGTANSTAPQCQTETWCHNGWCSSHCES